MTRIAVTPMEPDHFGVQVEEGDVTTSHRVAVSAELLDELGLTGADPARVVDETIGFLLDREPATNIQPELTLAEVVDRYEGFVDELRARLSG